MIADQAGDPTGSNDQIWRSLEVAALGDERAEIKAIEPWRPVTSDWKRHDIISKGYG